MSPERGGSNDQGPHAAHRFKSHLRHDRPTSSDRNTRSTSTACGQGGEDEGSCKSGKPEPQESCRRLSFLTSLLGIIGSVRDFVRVNVILEGRLVRVLTWNAMSLMSEMTHLVAAAVDFEISGERNTSDEEEDRVERIRNEHEHWRDRERFIDCSGDQIEQREHSKDCHEHAVIDNGRIPGFGIVNHATHQCHNEQRPEKLFIAQVIVSSVENDNGRVWELRNCLPGALEERGWRKKPSRWDELGKACEDDRD